MCFLWFYIVFHSSIKPENHDCDTDDDCEVYEACIATGESGIRECVGGIVICMHIITCIRHTHTSVRGHKMALIKACMYSMLSIAIKCFNNLYK